jgi:hypothetical protein
MAAIDEAGKKNARLIATKWALNAGLWASAAAAGGASAAAAAATGVGTPVAAAVGVFAGAAGVAAGAAALGAWYMGGALMIRQGRTLRLYQYSRNQRSHHQIHPMNLKRPGMSLIIN